MRSLILCSCLLIVSLLYILFPKNISLFPLISWFVIYLILQAFTNQNATLSADKEITWSSDTRSLRAYWKMHFHSVRNCQCKLSSKYPSTYWQAVAGKQIKCAQKNVVSLLLISPLWTRWINKTIDVEQTSRDVTIWRHERYDTSATEDHKRGSGRWVIE